MKKNGLTLALLIPLGCWFTLAPAIGQTPAGPNELPRSLTNQLPFTLPEVVDYFRESLEKNPVETRSNYALFRGGTPAEHGYLILVASNGPDLLVKFKVMDDYGMNMVREFFEAPFLRRAESEQLYALLYLGPGARTIELPRFDLVFDYQESRDSVVIALMFSPGGRYLLSPGDARGFLP